MQRPMSMNGYSWVEGNTPNMVDPTGMYCDGSFRGGIRDSDCGAGGLAWIIALVTSAYTATIAAGNLIPGPNGEGSLLEELADALNDTACDVADAIGDVVPFADTSNTDADTNTGTTENVQEQEDEDTDEDEGQIVRHYTGRESYRAIINSGQMLLSVNELSAGGPGLYFYTTDGFAHEFNNSFGFSRLSIWNSGILPLRSEAERLRATACYIDINQRLLSETPTRKWRRRMMIRMEHIYTVNDLPAHSPINVGHAIVGHGSVFSLDPEGNSDRDTIEIFADFGLDESEITAPCTH